MTDQLEELLLAQEQESDEPDWWRDRRLRSVPERQTETGERNREESVNKPEETVPDTKIAVLAGEESQKQTQVWTAQELERVRRIARRAVQSSTGKERAQRNGQKAEPFAGAGTSTVLKDSPAAGRQGLTAQIDMQFRRDARRYDGRLGLL